jgi:hypothetical protein
MRFGSNDWWPSCKAKPSSWREEMASPAQHSACAGLAK